MASGKIQNAISIGGDAHGNVMVAGENNTVSNVQTNISLPAPESVNIQKELAALGKILARLETPDKGKMERALTDAQEEAAKPKPDKDEVGSALERVMKHAQKAGTFGKIVEELKPHVLAVSAWLGSNWHHMARMLGM